MNGTVARFLKIVVSSAALVLLGCILTTHAAGPKPQGIPSDWSHKHLIFSHPASPEQAARLNKDPRYQLEIARRERALSLPARTPEDLMGPLRPAPSPDKRKPGKNHPSEGLWSMDLGAAANPGAGNYPAKFSFFNDTENCASDATPDYTVYSTGLDGGFAQASIVAYDNLYELGGGTGCSGTVPQTYWAYDTLGTVLTSPALSVDGTQVAFVETSGGVASLVLLTWKASTGSVTRPAVPTTAPSTSYRSCTAPCMALFPLFDGALPSPADDTTSSVFIDYGSDTAYVGDSLGYLHMFTGVFKGTPAEVTTSPWPILLNATVTSPLTSPVYDFSSGLVFVTDSSFLYSIDPSGNVTQTAQVDFGAGLVDGPLVDSTAETVFVFSSNDDTTRCGGPPGGPCSAVFEYTTSLTSGAPGQVEVTIGNSSTNPVYLGAFDSAYFVNFPRYGNLYVCGNDSSTSAPALYQIPVLASFLTGPANEISTLATGTPACSPVSDVAQPTYVNETEERVFVSVQGGGTPLPCDSDGCIIELISRPWTALTNFSVGEIILDSNDGSMICITAGKSGPGPASPTWPGRYNTAGETVTDGTVTWLDQGSIDADPLPGWQASHVYSLTNRIVDSNNNIEAVVVAGTSGPGPAQPTWSTGLNTTTTDNGVTWLNAGPAPVNALEVTGGTSGIIMDNGIKPLNGGSQVYFGTLGAQATGKPAACGGTGGCAVQASQAALR
jgi:hypothetical protein